MKAGHQQGHSDSLLRTLAAFGINHICGGLPSRTLDENWSVEGLTRLRERVESFGLRLGLLPLHGIPNVILGTPERDRDIEQAQQSIQIAGRVGIPVLEYSFIAIRPSSGYYVVPGRGGSSQRRDKKDGCAPTTRPCRLMCPDRNWI